MGFPCGSVVKNLPIKQEVQVQSLGQEDPLEKEMATHSSILAWRIPWTEDPAGLQFMGSQRAGHDLATKQQQQADICPGKRKGWGLCVCVFWWRKGVQWQCLMIIEFQALKKNQKLPIKWNNLFIFQKIILNVVFKNQFSRLLEKKNYRILLANNLSFTCQLKEKLKTPNFGYLI